MEHIEHMEYMQYIEYLPYLLIPLGLFLLYNGIKYTLRFAKSKMLFEMPYVNKEGNFQLDESGTYGIWLSGKMFTKAPIGEFGFAIVNEQTGKRISIMPSIMRTRVTGFTNSRIELYTFSANAGSYTLSLTNDPSLLDTVSGALGKVVSKKAVDYTQFSIQIYKNKPTILLFLCTWLIMLGFFSFVGGIILAVLTGTKI